MNDTRLSENELFSACHFPFCSVCHLAKIMILPKSQTKYIRFQIIEECCSEGSSQPHIHVGKGGGGGAALHHTAIVTDPVSQTPVVVEKITTLGSSGGLLGASSGQFSLDDAQISSFGPRRLYRVGQSQVPFGLSGLDYYSYPASLLSGRRGFGGKNIFADNLSGLSPIGYGARRSAIIADPSTSQFSVGDAQIRSNVFGGRGLYRTGLSAVPYGLSGLDYYSYPRSLFTQGRGLGSGLGQTRILSGGGFTAGDSQISGLLADPIGQERVIVESGLAGPTIVQAAQEPEQITTIIGDGGFGQRQVITKSTGGLGGLRGGQILLRGGPALGVRRVKSRPVIQAPVQDVQVLVDATSGLGAPFGGFGQRQVITKSVAPAPVIQAPVFAAPAPIISAPVRRVVNRGLGEAFFTQAVRPRLAARRIVSRPQFVSQPRVAYVDQGPRVAGPGNIQFTLGNTQIIGGAIAAQGPSVSYQRPVVAVQRPTYVQRPVVAVQRPAVAIQRPVLAVQRPVVAVQRPVVAVQQPQVISQVKTTGGFGGRRVFGRQIPQMFYVDGGSRFPGIDNLGGYRIGDPRFNYAQLPISTRRFANLGLSQGSIDAGPVLVAPAAAPAFLSTKSSPLVTGGGIGAPITKSVISQGGNLGFSGIGHTSPAKVVTQEEVIGITGDRQIVTTVQDAGPSKIGGAVLGGGLAGIGQTGTITTVTQSGPSKIGGLASGGPLGLAGIGQVGGTKTITQEEVIGPAGDSQIVTTVHNSGPSKIGGPVAGGLGIAGIGQTSPAQVVEVIGPAGDSQILTTVTNAGPSKIGGLASGGPLGLAGIGQGGGTKTITQEEVIGPAGDSQIVTTVTNSGPSKIGGPVVGGLGLAGIGQTSPAKVVTQEEVIGPAGDSQIVTTITETGSGPSKIGGAAIGSPFGISSIGQAPAQVISQEEVIGLGGDSQVITTVSQASPQSIIQQEDVGLSGFSSLTASPFSQIAQDPIESALSQQSLGDNVIISSGSSVLSPLGQSSVDDVFGQSAISTGTGLGELSQLAIGGGGLSDPIVQQSISSGFGNAFGFNPRVSFLSQHPYDVPSRTLLRQAVTRPFIQDQQQLEQILV